MTDTSLPVVPLANVTEPLETRPTPIVAELTALLKRGAPDGTDIAVLEEIAKTLAERLAGSFGWNLSEDGKTLTYTQGDIDRIRNFEEPRLWAMRSHDVTPAQDGAKPAALMVIGAPGSGKTQLRAQLAAQHGPYIELNQDEQILMDMSMQRTLHAQLHAFYKTRLQDDAAITGLLPGRNHAEKGMTFADAVTYTYLRWASHYIYGSLLNRAAAGNYPVALDSTGESNYFLNMVTGDSAASQGLVTQGYKLDVAVIGAPEDIRRASVEDRNFKGTRYTPLEHVSRVMPKTNLIGALEAAWKSGGEAGIFHRTAPDSAPVMVAAFGQERQEIHNGRLFNRVGKFYGAKQHHIEDAYWPFSAIAREIQSGRAAYSLLAFPPLA